MYQFTFFIAVGIDIKYIDETDDELEKEDAKLIENNVTADVTPPTPNGDASHSIDEAVDDSVNEASPMLNEIQSEIEQNSEHPKETDALVENS